MNRQMIQALQSAALLTAAVAALMGCQGRTPGAESPASASAPAAASAAVGAAPQLPTLRLAPLDLVLVQQAPLRRGVEVSGTIKAVDRAVVKAKSAGELHSLLVREGDAVRAGQIVARIDATEAALRVQQAQRQADAASAQLDIARRQLENNRALQQQGFISPTALETTSANEAAARANLAAAQAATALAVRARDDATVRAPLSGQVSQRLAQPGERVALGAGILEIVDLSRLELAASVPPADAPLLRVGAAARLQIEGQGEAMNARVQRINPVAAPGSRAITAYLALAGGNGLRDGLFARGWVELDQRETLVLPESAVRLDGARPYAVRIAEGRAEHRPLSLGLRGRLSDGSDAVEVLQGLAAGDRIIDASAGAVPAGTPVILPAADATAPAPAASRGERR